MGVLSPWLRPTPTLGYFLLTLLCMSVISSNVVHEMRHIPLGCSHKYNAAQTEIPCSHTPWRYTTCVQEAVPSVRVLNKSLLRQSFAIHTHRGVIRYVFEKLNFLTDAAVHRCPNSSTRPPTPPGPLGRGIYETPTK